MTSGVMMVMNGLGSPHVFFEPLCKCSAQLPYIFFITVHTATLESVDHSTLLKDLTFVLGVHQEVLDGTASFESSAQLPYIFFITVHTATLESVDHSTLLKDLTFVLGVHQEVLDGTASFEIHFNPMFSTDVFAALTHPLDVWDHYVRLVVTACFICVFACPLISTGLLILFNAGPG